MGCSDTLRVGNGVTRGCPQGSAVGPPFWNILFGMLMNLPYGEGICAIVDDDDWMLLVKVHSIPELEKGSVQEVLTWYWVGER